MPRISSKKRPLPQVVADLRECVFSVIRHRVFNGQNAAIPLGSGFFVSPNVFFTCYHVLNTSQAPHLPGDWYQLVSNFGQHGNAITVNPAEIGQNIHLYSEKDTALIHVDAAPAQQRFVVLDFGDALEGMDIGVVGYPLARLHADNNGVLQFDGLIYRVARGVVTSKLRQNIQTLSGDPLIREVDTIEVNFLFVPGNSGGPIFEAESGRVYAFVHGFRAEKIAENYFDTIPPNIAQGAPAKHIESLHAIYSVGIRISNVRAELQALGVAL